MNENSIHSIIDEMLKELSPDQPAKDDGQRHSRYGAKGLPVTFWLPIEYKEKYDTLQGLSRYKFGKLLKEVFKKTIDKVSA